MNYTVVINHEYGSNGRLAGKLLAEKLGIPCFDKDLIKLAADKSGFSEDYVRETLEKKTTSLLYSLYMASMPLADQVFLAMSKVIKELAEKEPCVIVGACSDYVLKEQENLVKVFIHAPFERRLLRVKEEYKEPADNYRHYLAKLDKKRATYYNYFTHFKWGDLRDYHITLDSTAGADVCAGIAHDYIKKFLKI